MHGAAKGAAVALVDLSPIQLSIARDDDKVIVARDAPIVYGEARRATSGSITDIVAVPHRLWATCHPEADDWVKSTVSESAPGTAPALLGLIVGFILALLVTVGVSRAVSGWLGVPLGIAITVAATAGAFRQQDRAERIWRDRHHVLLDSRDQQALHRGRAAVAQVVEAWPRVGGLVGVGDPTPALAEALWDLAGVLAHRQAVRGTRDDLARATVGLPPASRVWREIASRREQAESELVDLDREAGRRLAYLSGLASECGRFVLEQDALAHARRAVLRADLVLGRAAPVAVAGNGSEELAERTRAVLSAYRELTNHLGVEDI
jgi:hypothetical protein